MIAKQINLMKKDYKIKTRNFVKVSLLTKFHPIYTLRQLLELSFSAYERKKHRVFTS